jgi:hypothetical protein
MNAIFSAIALMCFCGMLVIYPMYFFALNDFKNKLIEHEASAWNGIPDSRTPSAVGRAYLALRLSKGGRIGDIVLCDEVLAARRTAVRLLYAGMICFMLFLSIGLGDAIQNG